MSAEPIAGAEPLSADAGPTPPAPPAEARVAAAAAAPAPDRILLHMPIDVRSVSLGILAVLACVYMLHWAAAVFVPLLLALMLSYALSPVVLRLQRWHLPRALGAAVLLLALVCGTGWVAYSLADDASALVETLPDAADKLRDSMRRNRGAPEGAIEKVQRAATKLEQAAEESGAAAPPPASRGVTRVQIERARFNIKDYLLGGTLGIAGFVGQVMVVLFTTYFLLISGDTFRRKMVKIAGPTLSKKKITVQLLDEINEQVQRYLLVQVLISALVGLSTWLALAWIGVERAAVWGIVATVLNFVPYVGSVITAAGLALVGFLQFGTIGMAALVSGVSLLIHTLLGNVLTPWLTSRASRMSPVVIFVGVLAFGWLWGVWGLLLGPPILMAVKAVCDRVDDLKSIGELLGS